MAEAAYAKAASSAWKPVMFSFLKNKKILPGLTGIDLRVDGVCLVRVLREPGCPPRVTRCDFMSWDSDESEEKVLSRLASQHDLKHIRCVTVLEPVEYSLLLTEAPDVPRDELKSAVRWRIKDLIDFHINDATLDVFDLPSPDRTTRAKSMYVVAARNEAIQRRADLCDRAGIRLEVIDIPDMAQRNLAAVMPEDVGGVVMLSLGPTRGLLTVTRQAELYMSRSLDMGMDMLTQGSDLGAYLDRIVLEVQRSLDYFDSHFHQAPIGHMVLAPGLDRVPGLLDHLNENLNVKARIMDLGEVLVCDDPDIELLSTKCLMALGAALRQEEKAL